MVIKQKIGFYIRNEQYGFLSNFWRAPQTVDGIEYQTNEHFYQSQKAMNRDVMLWIGKAPKAYQAMKAGRALRKNELIAGWEQHKRAVMLKGLRAKFSQNSDLAKQLLDTDDAYLFEDSPSDIIWGGRLEGSKNWLGELLMQVRNELRNGELIVKN